MQTDVKFLQSNRFKLYLAGLVAFLVMCLMAATMVISSKVFISTSETIHNEYLQAADQSNEARIVVLRAKSEGQTFFSQKHLIENDEVSKQHFIQFDTYLSEAFDALDNVTMLLADVSEMQWQAVDSSKALYLKKTHHAADEIKTYQADFHQLFQDAKTLGYKDQGVVGQFRTQAHALGKAFKSVVLKEPRLEVLLLQMRRNEKDFMLRQEQKYAQLFHQHEQELQQMLESVQFSKLDVKILNKQLADYGELFDVMVQTYAKFEHDVQKLHAMEEDLDEDLNQLHLLAESIAAEGLKDLDELAQEILFILVALLVLILVLVALFEVKVVRTMVDKINSLARGALKFSEGELDHRISVRGNDEFAMLAGMYNKMAVELGSSQRELEQFVYVASHDLQEPLRMVSSYTQLLAKRYEGQLDERADKYIHYAVDGATRMQSLINDLLEYSRINANPKALTRVSTQTLFNHAIMDLSVAIEEAKAEVKVDGELPDVIGDNVQLKQVFQNLISNAIKYNESTTPQVVISAKRKQNMWEISVADNGIGIPKEARQRAFQIFQRLHERDQYAGTGLGLAIVKKVMDQHQGSIRIESNEPHGSIFIFTLLAFEQYD